MDVVRSIYDSPLGPSRNSVWRPGGILAGVVDRVWQSVGVVPSPRERVLPDGTLELTLILGDDHRVAEPAALRRIPRASFGGMRTQAFVLDHPQRCDVLGVVLRPAGAYALLARPLSELTELSVDLGDLFGAAARELIDRCRSTSVDEERFRLVAHWVAERVARGPATHPAIAWMATQMDRTAGSVPIGVLRKEVALSKARVTGMFREQVGVPPKLYARLVRFQRTLAYLQRGDGRLADLALDLGYYDQAHMNAEFRDLGGLSPLQFIAARFENGEGNTARESG